MPRKIIIDTDPGQDDAVAILLRDIGRRRLAIRPAHRAKSVRAGEFAE